MQLTYVPMWYQSAIFLFSYFYEVKSYPALYIDCLHQTIDKERATLLYVILQYHWHSPKRNSLFDHQLKCVDKIEQQYESSCHDHLLFKKD